MVSLVNQITSILVIVISIIKKITKLAIIIGLAVFLSTTGVSFISASLDKYDISFEGSTLIIKGEEYKISDLKVGEDESNNKYVQFKDKRIELPNFVINAISKEINKN